MLYREHSLLERGINRARSSKAAQWIWYQHRMTIYSLGLKSVSAEPGGSAIGRDCWDHLLCYRSVAGLPDHQTFLAMARRRLDDGEHVYSICSDSVLLAWAWMVPNQRKSWLPAVRQEVHYPDHSCVLYGAYTLATARGRGFNGSLTRMRLADAVERYGARYAFTAISHGNEATVRAKRDVELTPWLELGCRVRFGRQWLTRNVLTSNIPSAQLTPVGAQETRDR